MIIRRDYENNQLDRKEIDSIRTEIQECIQGYKALMAATESSDLHSKDNDVTRAVYELCIKYAKTCDENFAGLSGSSKGSDGMFANLENDLAKNVIDAVRSVVG